MKTMHKQKLNEAWCEQASARRDEDWQRLHFASAKVKHFSRMLELDAIQETQEKLWLEQADNSPLLRAISNAITKIKQLTT